MAAQLLLLIDLLIGVSWHGVRLAGVCMARWLSVQDRIEDAELVHSITYRTEGLAYPGTRHSESEFGGATLVTVRRVSGPKALLVWSL